MQNILDLLLSAKGLPVLRCQLLQPHSTKAFSAKHRDREQHLVPASCTCIDGCGAC